MEKLSTKNPLNLEILVQGPGETDKELVIAGFFEYEEGEPELVGGAKQLDTGLKGRVMEIRKAKKKFSGKLGETHLFKSPENTIPGDNVMLVGLGPLKEFKTDVAEQLGKTAIQKANETSFEEICLAPEIKDAGVDPYDGHAVTTALIEGIMSAYQDIISSGGIINFEKFFLLAGKANEEKARTGLKQGLENYYKNIVEQQTEN